MSPAPVPPPQPVGIGNGWRWFAGAFGMVRRWPAVFLPMGLIAAVIYTLVPLVGRVALLIVGPAFLAGITLAAHATAQGHKPVIRQLFAMFQQPTQRSEALKLCIPLLLANIAAALMIAIVATHLLTSQGTDVTALEHDPAKLLAALRKILLSDPMHPWWLAAAGMVAFAWTFTALAIPHVALSQMPAVRAMGRSFRQVWGHLGAWIVAVVCLLVCLTIVTLVLQLTRFGVIVELGVVTVAYALMGPLFYLAWRDLGGTPTHTGEPPSPESRPPSPPPPSGILQA